MSSQEATPADGGAAQTQRDAAAPAGGGPAWRDETTRDVHRGIADRLVALTDPRTTLDVGCGSGFLVQALVEKGVDAQGIDDTEQALAGASHEVRARLEVHTQAKPLSGTYDLISCLDVVERLEPRVAQATLDMICAATDRVLFSSSPDGFADPSHVNVRPSSEWVASFAERGFFRRTDVNLDFVGEHALLLERTELRPRDIVHRYESALEPMTSELRERRQALARLQRERAASDKVVELEVELRKARHDVLTTRDHIIGLEAEQIQLQGQVNRLTDRMALQHSRVQKLRTKLANQQRRARRTEAKLERVLASRAWRIGRRLTRAKTPEL